jgi:CheY-like chemotaxis protein/HPt (histidine-containing phosphotransfer) domain-containing protein
MRAVKMLEKESFDCVLMDLHMPVMNGIDATKIIRNVNSDVLNHQVPIVALTADAFEETKSLTKEAGMNYFLSKPFSQDTLLEILLSATGKQAGAKIKVKIDRVPEALDAHNDHINLSVLKALIGDDTDTLIELLVEYIANAPIDYQDLKKALLSTDLGKIKSAAHKIKSTFKTFGIEKLAETAKEIEFGAKENMSLARLQELGTIIELDFLATIAEAKIKLETAKEGQM